MPLRCAILDDYQNVALKFADCSPLRDKIETTVFDKPFASSDEAVRALQDFEIVCAIRERTPFSHRNRKTKNDGQRCDDQREGNGENNGAVERQVHQLVPEITDPV